MSDKPVGVTKTDDLHIYYYEQILERLDIIAAYLSPKVVIGEYVDPEPGIVEEAVPEVVEPVAAPKTRKKKVETDEAISDEGTA